MAGRSFVALHSRKIRLRLALTRASRGKMFKRGQPERKQLPQHPKHAQSQDAAASNGDHHAMPAIRSASTTRSVFLGDFGDPAPRSFRGA